MELGNYTTSFSLTKEALGILRQLNDEAGIATALWELGVCATRPGDYEQAAQYLEESLLIIRKIGDWSQLAIILTGLAEVALRQGEYERAAELEAESLTLRRKMGGSWGIAVSLGNFAWIALRQGDLKQAGALLSESLTLRYEIGNIGGIAWCLEKYAEIAIIKGQQESDLRPTDDFQRAARLFGAAKALRAPVNSIIDLVDQPDYERLVAVLRARLGEETFTAVWAKGQAMTLAQVTDFALAMSQTALRQPKSRGH